MLSESPGTYYTDYAVLVRFNSTGGIEARNGGLYGTDTEIIYNQGTEYHFRLEIDIPAKTYSVYVTPEGQSEITLVTDYSFRSDQIGTTQLNYWTVRAGSGTHDTCISSGDQVNYHRADTNTNCVIDIDELIQFMNRWKVSIADVGMPEMMGAIAMWKSGSACS